MERAHVMELKGLWSNLFANASLKANHGKCILTPNTCKNGEQKIWMEYFFYIFSETVHENSLKYDINNDCCLANTVNGTRPYHSFIPTSCSWIEMRWDLSD